MNTTRLLRHVNGRNCLLLLRDRGPMSRAELARELGTTRSTVGYAIEELIRDGLVLDVGQANNVSGKGRPGSRVSLAPSGAYCVGVEVANSELTVTITDFLLSPLATSSIPSKASRGDVDTMVREIKQQVHALLKKARIGQEKIYGLGVSICGVVTPDGRVFIPTNPRWRDVPLAEILRETFPKSWTVKCCNDAAALALSLIDSLTPIEKNDAFVVMLASFGIGSARIRNGTVDKGPHGIAGELGLTHLSPSPGDGDDSLQYLAAETGIAQFDVPANGTAGPRGGSGRRGPAQKALRQWGDIIATGLANAIYLLDPALIIMAGPMTPLFQRVEADVRTSLSRRVVEGLNIPRIVVAAEDAQSAAVGSAALIRQELFALPDLVSPASGIRLKRPPRGGKSREIAESLGRD